MIYKLYATDIVSNKINAAMIVDGENISFLFDPANTDFQKFKADLAEGVELQDPDGNVMGPKAVAEFLAGLP
jgi:hypothetical protein